MISSESTSPKPSDKEDAPAISKTLSNDGGESNESGQTGDLNTQPENETPEQQENDERQEIVSPQQQTGTDKPNDTKINSSKVVDNQSEGVARTNDTNEQGSTPSTPVRSSSTSSEPQTPTSGAGQLSMLGRLRKRVVEAAWQGMETKVCVCVCVTS